MTPSPQECSLPREQVTKMDPVESLVTNKPRIVISGMSGMYPKAHNVKELSEILYNKVNPVTSEGLRWNYKHPELSKYMGITPDMERFDAQFFTVYHRLGNHMDPVSRKILEHTYQAMYDAGVSPAQYNGKKVAVMVGSSISNTELRGFINSVSKTGLGLVGCSKTMFANRVSYWLNVKGPSVAIDSEDCGSTIALEQAYDAFARGECEAAIVAGGTTKLFPQNSIYHRRIGAVSKDGKTKSFDENSDGYVLSDAIGVLFLQKAEDALRIYAEVKHVKNEYISFLDNDSTSLYSYFRNPQITAEFMKRFYKEAEVQPQQVEYVEAYGTGIPDADKSELEAIASVYCENRNEPLSVGSVTSNIGLTDAASGISAITKVLLGFHTGVLAGNLHCSEPRKDVSALRDGRMRIVTEHQRMPHSYAAINGMSLCGVNSHVLLHGYYKPKDLDRYKTSLPRLVTISGRQESAVEKIFNDLKSRAIDAEELALLHNIHFNNISGHLGRGFIILDTDNNQETVSLCEKAEYFNDASRPLWFVYSGMGSQWATMGAQLMRVPIFAAAIERCQRVLAPKGLDLLEIITSPDKTIFDNILHSFVGIAAIQIGLTDLMNELGLVPDGIIGHSVGELGCAYADGCLSAEEMILAAYSRGRVSLETPLIRGSMAAVGLGYEQISKMCPPAIDVACRNGPESSTISGPADVMREFVAQLTAQGIFAKEVPCSNIAYHSRYIADAGPNLLKYLKEVIKSPKARSQRWISSSVPQDKWNEDLAKYCSAEYQTNNLLSPVLFEETSRLIPSNAVLVEVAPHGLLQAILKRSLSADCRHVPLTKRGHPDNVLFLLQAIGDLYVEGYSPKVQVLYPKVEFPVSTGTPMLSHLPEWVHCETWTIHSNEDEENTSSASCKFLISIHDEESSYLQGNVVKEKTCYPFSAALIAVWDTLAMTLNENKKEVSIQFSDVHLHAQPLLHDQRPFTLHVALHRGTGRFEVSSEHSMVVSGFIVRLYALNKEIKHAFVNNKHLELKSQDVYQMLRDRGYDYSGEFRSIEGADASLREAALVWRNNWVTLIDGMLQLNVLRQPHDAVSQPKHIRQISINVQQHINNHTYLLNNKKVMPVVVNDVLDYTRCGGVVTQNVMFDNLPMTVKEDISVDVVPLQPTEIANTDAIMKIINQQKVTKPDGWMKGVSLRSSLIHNLDSLHWAGAPQIDSSDIIVTVHYAGINMLDVKKATGVVLCDSNSYGIDYSGTTQSGNRVMGIVKEGAASSSVGALPQWLWPVPEHWSLEDAATVPLAYAQAFYILTVKGQLCRGKSVLVHGGAGALGQAIIAIALHHNCQVFATVSDIRKKLFLERLFPQLKGSVNNSRDSSFADAVLFATNGKGCDIVVSSVKGRLKSASLKCFKAVGAFFDIVQIEDREHYNFGTSHLTAERSFITIDLSSIFTDFQFQKNLTSLMSEGIARGYVRPLSRVTYAAHDVTRAFQMLSASQHRGRVLLRVQDNVTPTQYRIRCNSTKSQLVIWNDDVFGVQLVDRLIHRGSKKICIHSTRPITCYHQFKINCWQNQGIEVVLSTVDINKDSGVTTLIKNTLSLGSIHGIFISNTTSNSEEYEQQFDSLMTNIDLESRSLHPQLRYFLVASTHHCVGQDICLSRSRNGQPATFLNLSPLKEGDVLDVRNAVEAVERALCSAHVVMSATIKQTPTPTLLERIAALAGIHFRGKIENDDTLHTLGMADEKIPAICSFLNISCNISLKKDIIPHLSVQKIKEIEESMTDIVRPNVKGLETIFSSVCDDELLATTDVLTLHTLYKDITLSQDELDVNLKYFCIVPGIEGHHGRFEAMCERLKLPALVLQPGVDHPNETVQETAQRLAEILVKKGIAQNNFYILGYESGVMVALELAAILEDNGLTGTVFCVGCAPDELQSELEEQLRELVREEQLHDAVIHHMSKLLADGDISGLGNVLRQGATWTEKVNASVRYLLGRMPHTAHFSKALIESALGRIEQARNYSALERPLRSQLVLLRAATARPSSQHSSLQAFSQQPVVVYQFNSALAFVCNDAKCASVINKHLDAQTLAAFEQLNHCESYKLK